MLHELRTARLCLRPLGATDLDALHGLWIDPDVRRFLWDDRVIDRVTVADVIARSEQLFATQGFGLLSLRWHQEDALVGSCGLYRFGEREPELIYSLAPAHWGLGLATEAARVVLADAFQRLGFARVLARSDRPNHASIRVMERLGMRFEGESVENGLPTVCYALAPEAWCAAP